MKKKNQTRGDAFTLTELIVVVGTVALLAGILLPAYATAGRKAGIVECKNNLRQVGTAIAAYSNDNINFLPGPMWFGCYQTYDWTPSTQYNMAYYLAPYFGLPCADSTLRVVPALICPASVLAQRYLNLQAPPFNMAISYIQCGSVTNFPNQMVLPGTARPFGYPTINYIADPPLKTSDIRRPSEQWAITDVDVRNGLGGTYSSYIPLAPVHNNRAGGPRQMARRNYLYFDWSVRSVETPW